MTSSLPPPTIFIPGESVWNHFLERLENTFLYCGVTCKEVKKAYLLAALNDEVLSLLHSLCLPTKVTNKNFEELTDLLTQHFKPVKSCFAARKEFYSLQQNSGETVVEFSARVRKSASDCQFGAELEVIMRDIFILGLTQTKIRERLMEEDPTDKSLTFSKALTLAAAKEASLKSTSAPQIKIEPSDSFYMSKKSVSSQKPSYQKTEQQQPCEVCGRKNHPTKSCKYKAYSCHKCHKKGHLAPVCKTKFLTEETTEEEVTLCDSFFNFPTCHQNDFTMDLNIFGQIYTFEIDTGSFYNIIAEKFYLENFKKVPLCQNEVKLCDYVGHKIHPMGKIKLLVGNDSKFHELEFHVIPNGGPPLIGRQGLKMLKSTYSEQILFVDPYIKNISNDISNIIKSYPKVFQPSLGTFSNYKITLQLKEGTQPKFFKARPLPILLKSKVEDELNRLLELGILEKVECSEWATPIVPVLKSDGSIRICGDYRLTINPVLLSNQYPLPRLDHICSSFGGAKFFSKIDLKDAYQQLLLEDKSKSLTTINTHIGLLRYTRLCFGITSAPGEFQKVVDDLLRGLQGVGSLLDDIYISGRTREEHNQRLDKVLKILNSSNLRVKVSKCSFGCTSMEYLGHKFDEKGLHATDKHIKAIINAPPPKDATALKSFLGLVSFHLKFIPNASEILYPLYRLGKKDVKFIWTKSCHIAFEKIKKILTSEPVLAHFDPSLPLQLTVDASAKAVGAVLSHIDDKNNERPIAYASKMLTDAQQKYATIEREAWAIIFGITHFKDYLFLKEFTLVTDHRPLLFIFGERKGIPIYAANRLQRWAYLISNYNYKIKYIKSKENRADYLSRIECRGSLTDPDDKMSYLNFIHENLPFRISWHTIRQETRIDPILSQVIRILMHGGSLPDKNENLKPYRKRFDQLTVDHGCVMWGYRVIIPEKFQNKILQLLHANHLGAVKMKSFARNYFWWPALDRDIEQCANSCETCCHFRPSPPKAVLQPYPWPKNPWTRIHIDFLGPINKKISCFVVMDSTTKWIEGFFVSSMTAETAMSKLSELFARFGLPRALTSDGAKCFVGAEFSAFLFKYGIQHLVGAPFHPQSNGSAESAVKIVKKCILKSLAEEKNLSQSLNDYLLQYRNTEHATTGESPANLLLKRKPRTIFDLLLPSTEEIVETHQEKMIRNGGQRRKMFHVGELVWARDFRLNKPNWTKGCVQDTLGPQTYLIKTEDNLLWKRHLNQLWPYLQGNNSPDICQSRSQSPVPDDSIGSPRHCNTDTVEEVEQDIERSELNQGRNSPKDVLNERVNLTPNEVLDTGQEDFQMEENINPHQEQATPSLPKRIVRKPVRYSPE